MRMIVPLFVIFQLSFFFFLFILGEEIGFIEGFNDLRWKILFFWNFQESKISRYDR